MTINGNGNLLSLSTPRVMGILNCTPDSFYDGGHYNTEELLLKRAETLIQEGADILDIGGQSTRPNAALLSVEEEWNNIAFILEYLHKNYPNQLLSVDSFYSEIHRRADAFNVALINDISGGAIDSEMFATVAQLQKPYVLMHLKGTPESMQMQTQYIDVTVEVNRYFSEKLSTLKKLGVNDIILDPGFGFAKNTAQNFELLRNLSSIGFSECPILVGISRKSMVYKTLDISPQEALNGTSALHMMALERGANILRVHDVKAARECVQLYELVKNS